MDECKCGAEVEIEGNSTCITCDYEDRNEKQAVFEFLDDLRDSGETNMFGARPYIIEEFGCTAQEARALLSEWMKTFAERSGK